MLESFPWNRNFSKLNKTPISCITVFSEFFNEKSGTKIKEEFQHYSEFLWKKNMHFLTN